MEYSLFYKYPSPMFHNGDHSADEGIVLDDSFEGGARAEVGACQASSYRVRAQHAERCGELLRGEGSGCWCLPLVLLPTLTWPLSPPFDQVVISFSSAARKSAGGGEGWMATDANGFKMTSGTFSRLFRERSVQSNHSARSAQWQTDGSKDATRAGVFEEAQVNMRKQNRAQGRMRRRCTDVTSCAKGIALGEAQASMDTRRRAQR